MDLYTPVHNLCHAKLVVAEKVVVEVPVNVHKLVNCKNNKNPAMNRKNNVTKMEFIDPLSSIVYVG